MTELQVRSYSGRLFRPRPEIQFAKESGFLGVATPWGARSTAERSLQSLFDFYLSARDDQEVTSPFDRLSCLSSSGNHLRTAVKLTNDLIYREENRGEHLTGVELLAMVREGEQLIWAQIGLPHMLLDRKHLGLVQLSGVHEASVQHSANGRLLHPLPADLLGIHSTSDFAVHSFRSQPGDRLILLSRSVVPASLFSVPAEKRHLEGISHHLALADAESPFWLAVLELS